VNTQQPLRLGTDNLKSNNKYSKIFFDENKKYLIFVSMRKLILFIVLLVGFDSCSSPKKLLVKMPKWKKERKLSKKEIKNYTREFVNKLYDTTEVENIIQK
jgi:hypothetical protein